LLGFRSFTRRHGEDLALAEEENALAIGRGCRCVTLAQLDERTATEVDQVDLLYDPRGKLRRICCRLVGILEIATQHIQQFLMPRHEGDVSNIQAIIRAVVGEGVRLETPVRRARDGKPHVALAPRLADPGECAACWCGDDVGGKRGAQYLLDGEPTAVDHSRREQQHGAHDGRSNTRDSHMRSFRKRLSHCGSAGCA